MPVIVLTSLRLCLRCTGARQIATGLSELHRRKAKVGQVRLSQKYYADARPGSSDVDVHW